MRQLIRFACAVMLIALALPGCASSGKDAGAQPTGGPAVEQSAPQFAGLPAVDQLRELSYSAADLVQTGSQFLAEYGQRIIVPGASTQALFNPDYVASDPEHHDLAYGLYAFTLADYDRGAAFELSFQQAQANSDLWLGLADWDSAGWDWFPASATSSTVIPPAQMPAYLDAGDRLVAAVVCLGEEPWTLNELRIDDIGSPYVNADAILGMNLAGIPDWGRAWVFVDVFKHSRSWISQPSDGSVWDDGRTVAVDADGWPTSLAADQYAGNVLLTSQQGNYPSGEYICLYEGEGTINFRINGSIVSQTAGRIVVDIDNDNDGLTHIQITSTNPADPVRNIRLLMPGFETTYETQLFHPDFLACLAPYQVLRFMDWMETNGSTQQYWADRPTPQSHSQAEHGVCVEYMVELANRVCADPWFCMPHRADDDYVRQFATYVRDNLDGSLRVYLEHSNEVWNGGFEQANYARERGLALGLSENDYQAQLFYHSRRSVEIFAIWEEVFGGTERLVRVLAAQHANPWTGEQVMSFEDAWQHADALGTAPYFGYALGLPENAEATKAMSISQILAACDQASQDNALTTAENYANAQAYGLGLVTYEGGQHLVGVGTAQNDEDLTALFIAVNRDPGMRQVYLDDCNRWRAASGGGLFTAFSHISSPSKYGSWGVLEWQQQDTATTPKLLGLMDYSAQWDE
ncbi:hypothetical protein JW859_15310 [bacterium]|nr:hypothetical protein [bacterium]